MSAKETLVNTFGTLVVIVIAIICATVIPFEIINSKSHTVFTDIGNFRFIGPVCIFIGVVGYLACCWSFIAGKGMPAIEGMQKQLIVNGLYRFVRNPIYISWYLIIFGEAVYFQSRDLLLYLLFWIVFFHIRVVFCEEPYLSVTFGESYESYRKSVPRWIPRLKAYLDQ